MTHDGMLTGRSMFKNNCSFIVYYKKFLVANVDNHG